MFKVILPYWKTVDFIIIIVAAMIVLLALGCGKHYDCRNLPDMMTPDEAVEAYKYCVTDPMDDFTKNEYGETRDWKDGQYRRQ